MLLTCFVCFAFGRSLSSLWKSLSTLKLLLAIISMSGYHYGFSYIFVELFQFWCHICSAIFFSLSSCSWFCRSVFHFLVYFVAVDLICLLYDIHIFSLFMSSLTVIIIVCFFRCLSISFSSLSLVHFSVYGYSCSHQLIVNAYGIVV